MGMNVNQSIICSAIKSRNLISFYYTGDDRPGIRTVEPFMIAHTSKDHLSLSAWFLYGASESGDGQGWRDYLLSDISQISVLPQTFLGNRPGYRRDGGKKFHNVLCAL